MEAIILVRFQVPEPKNMATARWLYFLCIREASHFRGLRLGIEARSDVFVCPAGQGKNREGGVEEIFVRKFTETIPSPEKHP